MKLLPIEKDDLLNAKFKDTDECLAITRENKTHRLLSVSTYMIDTVDCKIAEDDHGILDEEVWRHPMMMSEMKRQIETTR